MWRFILSAALIGVLAQRPAAANDTVVGIGAGGLEFRTTDAVSMEKETLYISRERIKVDYVFRNVTDAPVDMHIAFPLPDLPVAAAVGVLEGNYYFPNPNSANFVDFEAWVNGRPISTSVETKAYSDGNDVTQVLRDLKLPFDVPTFELQNAIDDLSDEDTEKLRTLGITRDCGSETTYDCPAWALKTIFYWQQKFAPRETIKVSHSYKPSWSYEHVILYPINFEYERPESCVDTATSRGLAKVAAQELREFPEKHYSYYATGGYEVEYILTTANSWKGPIKDFRLIIDKGDPRNFVSLCLQGLKKTGPTTFEMRKKNFRPMKELKVFFIGGYP